MALSRLASMPPELKLLTCAPSLRVANCDSESPSSTIYDPSSDSEFHPHDLLSISHVSKFWRSLVLEDRRWNEWFDLISTESEGTAEAFLSRYKVLTSIPKRAIVTLCLYNKCSGCSEYTTDIFLPLLKRVCVKCRRDKKYAVISVSSALATYDLKEADLGDVLVLSVISHSLKVKVAHKCVPPLCSHWEETNPQTNKRMGLFSKAKLMSESVVKEIAIQKHGSEANLAVRLEHKRTAARTAYDKRVAEYTAAIQERARLTADGNLTAAAAVGIGKTNKRIPKSRPALPPILKASGTPPFYQNFVLFQFGFLAVGGGRLSLRNLVRCRLCILMENLREADWNSIGCYEFKWTNPGVMPPELVGHHREKVHYDRERVECRSGCEDHHEGRCDICLNASAVWLEREHGMAWTDEEDCSPQSE
ncbi:hypothetical protein B0H13DRAFT_2658116 [Mycena leptocephala]|nr:hypothetical protein B0H13DRAFT_2658116 [Mycena leptocephala]